MAGVGKYRSISENYTSFRDSSEAAPGPDMKPQNSNSGKGVPAKKGLAARRKRQAMRRRTRRDPRRAPARAAIVQRLVGQPAQIQRIATSIAMPNSVPATRLPTSAIVRSSTLSLRTNTTLNSPPAGPSGFTAGTLVVALFAQPTLPLAYYTRCDTTKSVYG